METTTRPSVARRALRILGKVVLWGVATVCVLLAGVAGWARVAHARDATRWKAPGRLVEVESGRRLHLYCTGQGSPTVVLEAGLGDFSVNSWRSVQPTISGFTRACSYDRAGTGWSDPGRALPMPTQMVEDLHALLGAAGETGPFLLAGHSLGGPIVRHYARHYPAEVAGLVLVDGSHEDQITRLTEMPKWADLVMKVIPVVHALGVDRLAAGAGAPAGDTLAALAAAVSTSDKMMANTALLSNMLPSWFAEVKRDAKPFGDLPLTALTAGRMSVPGIDTAAARRTHDEWVKMHQEIVARSTRGKWILADKSQHFIQNDQPDLVIGAIREMVDSLRARAAATPPAAPRPGA